MVAITRDVIAVTRLPIPTNTFAERINEANTFAERINEVRAKKVQQGIQILSSELAANQVTIEDAIRQDNNAAITYTFLRAASEGSAQFNLRILAKVLRSYTIRGEHPEETYLHLTEMLNPFLARRYLLLPGYTISTKN